MSTADSGDPPAHCPPVAPPLSLPYKVRGGLKKFKSKSLTARVHAMLRAEAALAARI